ncbi:basic proline-rich protein-like [Meriones unguiculatus]|uniref:basic proline-rich protein-like n=1 Tax=Meriones unguiculatus TaxID=10047 RepID=UPI00293EB037|nr:basic proline-rich protein-like [Meriones unguiculatus]
MARALEGPGNPDGATVTPGGRGRSAPAPPSSSPAAAAGSEREQTALGRRPAGRPRPPPAAASPRGASPRSARRGPSFPGAGGRARSCGAGAPAHLPGSAPRPVVLPPLPSPPRRPGCSRQPAALDLGGSRRRPSPLRPRAAAPRPPAGPRHARAASASGLSGPRTRGHCRKPVGPAPSASRLPQPIPRAGAPPRLQSLICRGAGSPTRPPVSAAARCCSGSRRSAAARGLELGVLKAIRLL